jgi:hypothetical protein
MPAPDFPQIQQANEARRQRSARGWALRPVLSLRAWLLNWFHRRPGISASGNSFKNYSGDTHEQETKP